MQIFRPKRGIWLSSLWMSPFFLGWFIFSIKLGQGTENVWLAILRCFGPAILPTLFGLYRLTQLRHYQISVDPQGITFVFLNELGKAQKPLSFNRFSTRIHLRYIYLLHGVPDLL